MEFSFSFSVYVRNMLSLKTLKYCSQSLEDLKMESQQMEDKITEDKRTWRGGKKKKKLLEDLTLAEG
jgi:hypothetical protein